jgi:hypothetical protein
VYEPEPVRVQTIPYLARQNLRAGVGDSAPRVERISKKRMAECGEVDPDLVRPSGLDLDLDERAFRAGFDETDPAPGRLPVRPKRLDGSQTAMRHGTDGIVEQDILIWPIGAMRKSARYQRPVSSLHPSHRPRGGELSPRDPVPREEHDSRRAPPQPVQGRRFRKARAHPVKERALEKPPAGHGGKSGGLGDRHHVFVPMQDGERRRNVRLAPRRSVPYEGLAGAEQACDSGGTALDQHEPVLDVAAPLSFGRVAMGGAEVGEERQTFRGRRQALHVRKAPIELRDAHRFLPTT